MHSAFFSFCEGLGWSLAAGLSTGALAGAGSRSSRLPLAVVGAVLAAVFFYIALSSSDHTAWPGIPLGVLLSLPAFVLAEGLVAGAASRQEGSTASVAGIVVFAAVVLGVLFLIVAPVSLPFAVAVLALLAVRRHAGTQARGPSGPAVSTPPPAAARSTGAQACPRHGGLAARRHAGAPWPPATPRTSGSFSTAASWCEDCVSTFPSVTPVASSEMVTGLRPDGHGISAVNWFQPRRAAATSSTARRSRRRAPSGSFRTLYDIVYDMNMAHLSAEAETVFERLGDAGIRTACTPFLIYRGRRRHEVGLEGVLRRVALAASFRHAVWGPDELFYGELYASRRVPCKPTLARPGTRDEYSGCVGRELARDELYDFLLFSLPDNDHHSHRFGPEATGRVDRARGPRARRARRGVGRNRALPATSTR